MACRTHKRSAARKGGRRNAHGRATGTKRTPRRTNEPAGRPKPHANPGGVCRVQDGVVGQGTPQPVADEPVAISGTLDTAADPRTDARERLIDAAITAGHAMVRRLIASRWHRRVLPIADAVRMTVEARIEACDNLVAYDVIADARDTLAALLPQLGMALVQDADALERIRELAGLKEIHGTEPVIHGGRERGEIVNKETAATDRSGQERRRIAACAGTCPRAMAGQRAGRQRSC